MSWACITEGSWFSCVLLFHFFFLFIFFIVQEVRNMYTTWKKRQTVFSKLIVVASQLLHTTHLHINWHHSFIFYYYCESYGKHLPHAGSDAGASEVSFPSTAFICRPGNTYRQCDIKTQGQKQYPYMSCATWEVLFPGKSNEWSGQYLEIGYMCEW